MSLVPAGHAVEGLLSAVILNIVVGLMTSLISGGSVWAWGRARVTRRQRERARFFGLSPGDTGRIVAPKLMRDLKADLDVVSSGEGAYGIGDLTEFCVGGPTANVRMQSHLARFLPGVSIRSFAPDSPESAAIVAAGQEFLRERDSREYVLVAKVRPLDGGHPLFLICGQTAITNRAAVSYLRDHYRRISSAYGAGQNWCVVLRVVAPSVYGHQMTELAADVSASAFSAVAAAGGPA
jgi:hypothetical protein